MWWLLMEIFSGKGITQLWIQHLNVVRLYWGVATVSDTATAKDKSISFRAFNAIRDTPRLSIWSTICQPNITTSQRDLWQQALQT